MLVIRLSDNYNGCVTDNISTVDDARAPMYEYKWVRISIHAVILRYTRRLFLHVRKDRRRWYMKISFGILRTRRGAQCSMRTMEKCSVRRKT